MPVAMTGLTKTITRRPPVTAVTTPMSKASASLTSPSTTPKMTPSIAPVNAMTSDIRTILRACFWRVSRSISSAGIISISSFRLFGRSQGPLVLPVGHKVLAASLGLMDAMFKK